MNRHQLFINSLEDLESKINSKNEYQILKSTEILRTLLFDSSGPLVDKINKEFKIDIKFRYKVVGENLDNPLFKNLVTFICGDGFYPPNSRPNIKITETKKDQFFKALVIFHNQNFYTVKDVLDFSLYKLGGTHHEDPKTDKEKIFSELNNLYVANGNSIIFQCKSIGEVVLEGLKELRFRVINNNQI